MPPGNSGQQDHCVLRRPQGVSDIRDDQQVTSTPVPHIVARVHLDPTEQHKHGRLTGVLMLGELRPSNEGQQRLAQRMLMAAEHGRRCPPGRGSVRGGELPASQRIEGQLLRGSPPD